MLKQIKVNPAGNLAFVQALSHARLSNYRSFFGATDDAQALGLHQWNSELSAELFRTISARSAKHCAMPNGGGNLCS